MRRRAGAVMVGDAAPAGLQATVTRSADGSEPWDWPLPREPYTPGRTLRPSEDDDVHRVARSAPKHTDPSRWRSNIAYLAGHRLYAGAYYWEAHEVWEPVWMGAGSNTRERFLLQGLIQLANACLKLRMARRPAAIRLARMAAAHFREAAAGGAAAPIMAIDAAAMAAASEAFALALARDATCDVPPPHIVVVEDAHSVMDASP